MSCTPSDTVSLVSQHSYVNRPGVGSSLFAPLHDLLKHPVYHNNRKYAFEHEQTIK
jgi:hypothetical protein